jgi:hypothetical protein
MLSAMISAALLGLFAPQAYAEHLLLRFKASANYRPLLRSCRFTPRTGADYYVSPPATVAVLDTSGVFAGAAIVIDRQVAYGAIPVSCLGGQFDSDYLNGRSIEPTVLFETLPGESTLGFVRTRFAPRSDLRARFQLEESVIGALAGGQFHELEDSLKRLTRGPTQAQEQAPALDAGPWASLVKQAGELSFRTATARETAEVRKRFEQLMQSTEVSLPQFTLQLGIAGPEQGTSLVQQFTLEYMARSFRDEREKEFEKGLWVLSELVKGSKDRLTPPGTEPHNSVLFLYFLKYAASDGLIPFAPVLNRNHHLIQTLTDIPLGPVANPIEAARQGRPDFAKMKNVIPTRQELDFQGIQMWGGMYPKDLRDQLDHDHTSIPQYGRLERATVAKDRVLLFRYTYRWLEPHGPRDQAFRADVFDLIEMWAARGGKTKTRKSPGR